MSNLLRTWQRWAESQKTDSGSAPAPKTWTPNPLQNPVCRQILESECAPDPDFSLNLQPKSYVFQLCQVIEKRNILVSDSG